MTECKHPNILNVSPKMGSAPDQLVILGWCRDCGSCRTFNELTREEWIRPLNNAHPGTLGRDILKAKEYRFGKLTVMRRLAHHIQTLTGLQNLKVFERENILDIINDMSSRLDTLFTRLLADEHSTAIVFADPREYEAND